MPQDALSRTEWISIAKCRPQLLTLSVFTNDFPDDTLGEMCLLLRII